VATTNTTTWGLAQAGAPGPAGPRGATGATGPAGPGITHLDQLSGIGCDGPDPAREYHVEVDGAQIYCVTPPDPDPQLRATPASLTFPTFETFADPA